MSEQYHFLELLKRAVKTAWTTYIRPTLKKTVSTDSSQYAIGAVLKHNDATDTHPVAFDSRTLKTAEQNYAVHDQEILAILHKLRVWRPYLRDKPFLVHSDNYHLKYLSIQNHLSPCQDERFERIVVSNYQFIPIRNKANVVADALPRNPRMSFRPLITKRIAFKSSKTDITQEIR